jgi:hypothetical protein
METRKPGLGFSQIPTWMLRDHSIPRNALLVYAALSSYSGYGAIFPSQASLAADAGVSERTVRSMLGQLEALGVIERSRRLEPGSKRSTDSYLLRPNGPAELPAKSAGSSDLPETASASTGNGAHSTPLIEIETLDRNRTSEFSPEVLRLTALLVERVRWNGHRVGVVGASWWKACDQLLRLDGYSPEQVEFIIRWSTADSFWAANIRSMPKLREKFSTLVLQAKAQAEKARGPVRESAVDVAERVAARMERAS